MKTQTLTDSAKPLGSYPHIKIVGNFIFISGTSSRKPDNTHIGAEVDEHGNWTLDIRIQTQAVIQHIEHYLRSIDCDLSHIVDVTTFLVDMKDFDGYNEVYAAHFSSDGPTRTTVAVHQLPHPNLLIEMKVIAYKEL